MTEPPLKSVLQKPPGYRVSNDRGPTHPRPPYRKPAVPPAFYPKTKRRNCCRVFCCVLCIFILICIVFFIIAGGLFYLLFDPKLPVFHLQSFQIPHFNATAKPDGTYLNSQAVARVEVKNPNSKLQWFFRETHFDISVGEDDISIGSKDVPDFNVGKKNITSLKSEVGVKNQLVPDDQAMKLLKKFKSKDLLVTVNVQTEAGLVVQGAKLGIVGVNVLCGNVKFKQIQDGSMPKCTINLLNWINIH